MSRLVISQCKDWGKVPVRRLRPRWRSRMADDIDPPVRFTVVHDSARTRVTRLSRVDRTLIVKEPLGPDAESRLRNETAFLERLRKVGGVVQRAGEPPPRGSIVLADAGDSTL